MSDASQPEVDLLDSPEVVSLKFTGNRLHKSKGTWQFITNQGHPASIFGKYLFERRFVVKFIACLSLLGFSNIQEMV